MVFARWNLDHIRERIETQVKPACGLATEAAAGKRLAGTGGRTSSFSFASSAAGSFSLSNKGLCLFVEGKGSWRLLVVYRTVYSRPAR